MLNTLQSSVLSPKTGKYGPEKTPYLDTFHTESLTTVKTKNENPGGGGRNRLRF